MEQLKNAYIDCIEVLKGICEDQDITSNNIDRLEALGKETDNFKLTIPLIGNFSAGKTSLLNALIGEEIFKTDTLPETTIATELVYGDAVAVTAFKNNSVVEQITIEELSNLDITKYDYIQASVPCTFLSENPDVVLVDMPGLDSGIEKHNKAILNYIKSGVYYCVVIDIEDGTLKSNVINFLNEISSYGLNFCVVINKVDKKAEKDVNEILAHVKNSVKRFGDNIPVCIASANNNKVKDVVKHLSAINKQALFKGNFQERVLKEVETISQSIQIRLVSSSVDTNDIDETIRQMQTKEVRLNNELKSAIEGIKRKKGSNCEAILNEIKNEIISNIRMLAKTFLSSEERFQEIFSSLIRSIMIKSFNKNISDTIEVAVDNLNREFVEFQTPLEKLLDKSSDMAMASGSSLGRLAIGLTEKLNDSSSKFTGKLKLIGEFYKSVAGLIGLTTDIIAPWMEVIIFFMPEIISFLKGILVSEESKIQTIAEKIQNDILPQTMANLRPKILESYDKVVEDIIENTQNEFESRKTNILDALNIARAEKEKTEAEIQEKKEALQEVLQELEQCRLII